MKNNDFLNEALAEAQLNYILYRILSWILGVATIAVCLFTLVFPVFAGGLAVGLAVLLIGAMGVLYCRAQQTAMKVAIAKFVELMK